MLNAFESDLFFNLDHDEAKVTDCKGQFERFDDDKLHAQAAWFCECLIGCGGRELKPSAVVADFLQRL